MFEFKPNPTNRKMPTERAIRKHWSDRLAEAKGFDSRTEFMEPGTCFACGVTDGETLDRAHIKARVEGGDDSLENLHMLCKICHRDSEYLSGEKYMRWLSERNAFDRLISQSVRGGLNLSALIATGNFKRSANACIK